MSTIAYFQIRHNLQSQYYYYYGLMFSFEPLFFSFSSDFFADQLDFSLFQPLNLLSHFILFLSLQLFLVFFLDAMNPGCRVKG